MGGCRGKVLQDDAEDHLLRFSEIGSVEFKQLHDPTLTLAQKIASPTIG